ncbi:MAG TPA: DUF1993 domain-containing protein [Oligoflexus sp.]|uniref:DUF1993 domain-containing protein n=1 Tax=Oligoflexus sp. TaxID=1971216 RepID=UPI002D3AB36C|nr:DUF1993 domain-containing protein [Oligoflexus sp.]HYX33062.1 DUF1993 domain-containing protein [Oligoflexus sp.]
MFYEITITQFVKMLNNLSTFMEKGVQFAETKKFDVEVLLNGRLAPDQFNLIRQVQIACDTAKLGASRLTGKEAPSHADTEKTLPELKARIQSTIAYLQSFSPNDYVEAASRKISQPRWEGQWLTGEEFAIHHMIPNFYFHITTAYAILRHNGVDVGKKDYLGMMPYKK